MKQARDLFLLSALAYRQGKHHESATLYATAMASDDVDEFLNILNEEQTVTSASLSSVRSIKNTLEGAIATFETSLSEQAEDEVEYDLPEQLDEDDEDEEFTTSDVNPNMPGQSILPTSLSMVDRRPKIVLSSTLKSTVSIKAAA